MKLKHLAIVGCLLAGTAHAEYVSITKLQGWLSKQDGAGYGYLAATADTMTTVGMACIPGPTTLREISAVVQSGLETYDGPNPAGIAAIPTVVETLKNRWPCAGKPHSRKEML